MAEHSPYHDTTESPQHRLGALRLDDDDDMHD